MYCVKLSVLSLPDQAGELVSLGQREEEEAIARHNLAEGENKFFQRENFLSLTIFLTLKLTILMPDFVKYYMILIHILMNHLGYIFV